MTSTNPKAARPGALWVTMLQAGLLGLVAGLAGYVLIGMILEPPSRAQVPGGVGFQGGAPPFPGGPQSLPSQGARSSAIG
jgi:ABC-type uncharacterized transport system permease subunit